MKQNKILIKNVSISCFVCFFLHPFASKSMPSTDSATPIVEVPQIPIPSNAPQPAPTTATKNLGPETVMLPEEKVGIQGNWMKKKELLIKSNEIFDEIQNALVEIQATRKSFNEKYRLIDREFNSFYLDLGVDEGKLQKTIESIEKYLGKKKKKQQEKLDKNSVTKTENSETINKDYQLKIESLEAEIKQNKNDLEQLKLDFQSISDLDKSIFDRIKHVGEQITQAKSLFDKAKTLIDELWYVIDDKKARAIYYDLKLSTAETVKAINAYLKDDLSRDFDTVCETARSQMQKAKATIKKLEDAGVIIKNRSQRIEQIKLEEQAQIENAKKAAALIKTKEEVIDLKKINKRPMLWYEKMYDYVITTATGIYRYFASFLTPIPKTPKKANTQLPAPQILASQQQPQEKKDTTITTSLDASH